MRAEVEASATVQSSAAPLALFVKYALPGGSPASDAFPPTFVTQASPPPARVTANPRLGGVQSAVIAVASTAT
jgi:hypothetical protein